MKKCVRCSAVVNDTDRFCQFCGGSEFSFEYNQNVQDGAPAQAPYVPTNIPSQVPYASGGTPNQVSNMQTTYSAQPVNAPKKKKTGLIVGVVLGCLALLVVLGIFVGISGSGTSYDDYNYEDDYNYNNEDDYDYGDNYEVDYTKGNLVAGVYANEWADISFALTDGWVDGDQGTYNDISNEYVDCGLFAEDLTKGSTITVAFVDANATNASEDELVEYLEGYNEGAISALENHTVSDADYLMVGDYSYLSTEIHGDSSGVTIYFTNCIRELDGYIVIISVSGLSKATNNETLDKIMNSAGY